MNQFFCSCGQCGKDINVGDIMYSIVLSQDYIVDIQNIQPLEVNEVVSWCEECAPKAINEMAKAC